MIWLMKFLLNSVWVNKNLIEIYIELNININNEFVKNLMLTKE